MTTESVVTIELEPLAVYPNRPAPPSRTLLDVLADTAERHPEAPAVEDEHGALDYRTLLARADQLAQRLRNDGVGPGDLVGVRLPSGSVQLYVAILGVLASGAGYVPVDADDPDERARDIWSAAGVCASVGPRLEITGHSAPTGRGGRPGLDDTAWVIFTSGSTGRPKGVAVSHRAAAAFVDAERELFLPAAPLGPGDRVLAGLSVAFDASCEEMWLAWGSGACLVAAARSLVRAGADLAPWLAAQRITVVSTVPTLALLWPVAQLRDVRLLILGGESCPAELARRLAAPHRELWNTYGPTEATVVSSAAPLRADEPVRIGLPLPGWQLAVVDAAGDPVRWGERGELVIGGVGLGRYLDAELDATRYAPLPALGWERGYRSGDLVVADPDGLRFAGRADDQVKISGRRIELGEVDAALLALDRVAAAAAAVRRTPAGADLLVGYLVAEPGTLIEVGEARRQLLDRLPAALVPVLCVVPELPTRTSGKVDRAALPWPLPSAETRPIEGGPHAVALAEQWRALFGPVEFDAQTDFFAIGGTSLAAAQLVSALRVSYPGASVADVYQHPTFGAFARRLAQLGGLRATRRVQRRTPRWSGAAQLGVLTALLTYRGAQWLLMIIALDSLFGPATWGTTLPLPLIALLWVVLFSSPARLIGGTVAIRLLTRGIGPGRYLRGAGTHLRLWTAERVAGVCGLASFVGTPAATTLARRLGCTVGEGVRLDTLPPLTGLAVFEDGASVEGEADIQGYWVDGDELVVGTVHLGAGSRIGARATLLPGAVVGAGAEVEPGACVADYVPPQECWAGAPARRIGAAGEGWPAPREVHATRWRFGYGAALLGRSLFALGIAALILVILGSRFGNDTNLGQVFVDMLEATPLAVVIAVLVYMAAVVITVRLAARGISAGYHPDDGKAAFCSWLTYVVTGDARSMLYPLYASLLTPIWLRLLGAEVGRNTEASTVVGLPSMTVVGANSFLADDALLAPPRLRGGWMHLGPASVGDTAFVGNSAIVGVDRAVGDGGLIGVLSAAPHLSAPGTSWLGQPAIELPRTPTAVDPGRTLHPPRRLVAARAGVELLRLLPMVLSLGLLEFGVVSISYVDGHYGLLPAALTSGLVLLLLGVVATALSVAAKWLLVGRVRAAEHPLWTSFVWRNELADSFTETLAVPWLIDLGCGTPLLSWWLRAMGARVGSGVWCDTWWLPEQDLVRIGDGVVVNRGSVVQTHLFHDRLMRLDFVELADGATVGPHGVVLLGGRLGANATTAAASLVMRGESIPDDTRWLGNPISPWAETPDDPLPQAG